LPESSFGGASHGTNVSPGSSVTYFGNYGNSAGAAVVAATTEAEVELVHRGPDVTIKDLRVVVTTNGRAATSSVTTRKNNADTSQVATITASTTGTYTDLSNQVSVTAADKVAYKLIIGSTSGTFAAPSITVNLESASQSANFWSAITPASTTNGASTRYWNLTGVLNVVTNENTAQSYAPVAGTVSNLRAYVTAARATNTTLKSRDNSADGAMSVTLTASTTGAFEDTTNSDTVAVGDLLCAATVTGSGSDTLTISNMSVCYTPSTAGASALGSAASSATLGSGLTRYYPPLGNMQAIAAESQVQQIAPFAGTASYLASVVSANASTSTVTMVLRKGGADTAVTYTIGSGATGAFADTSNSVSVAAGDLLAIQGSGSNGTVTFRSMGLRYTASAGPIAGTASITEASDTVSSTGAVALSATAAITEADDTVSSAAALAVQATASITEASDTVASTGALAIAGALSVTEDDDTLTAFSGGRVATASITEDDDTLLSDALLLSTILATLGITEADDTLSSASRSRFWAIESATSESWSASSATPAVWTVQ
jgi:hypothetical protein